MEPAQRDQGKSISNKKLLCGNASSPWQEEQVSALGEPQQVAQQLGEGGWGGWNCGGTRYQPGGSVSLGADATFLGTEVEQQERRVGGNVGCR